MKTLIAVFISFYGFTANALSGSIGLENTPDQSSNYYWTSLRYKGFGLLAQASQSMEEDRKINLLDTPISYKYNKFTATYFAPTSERSQENKIKGALQGKFGLSGKYKRWGGSISFLYRHYFKEFRTTNELQPLPIFAVGTIANLNYKIADRWSWSTTVFALMYAKEKIRQDELDTLVAEEKEPSEEVSYTFIFLSNIGYEIDKNWNVYGGVTASDRIQYADQIDVRFADSIENFAFYMGLSRSF